MVVRSAPARNDSAVVQLVELDLSGPLNAGLVAALTDACAGPPGPSRPVVVLRLAGGAARAGQWPGPVDVYQVGKWEGALRRLERLDAFTVAVLDGHCTQGAFEVLLAVDHRLAMRTASVAVAGGAAGMWPGVVLHRMVHQLGLRRARRLALLPEKLDAAALLELTVVDGLTDDVDAAIKAIAARSAGVPGSEIAVCRQLLFDALTIDYDEALGAHLAACDRRLRRTKAGPAQ
jgi:isomerase DpgB